MKTTIGEFSKTTNQVEVTFEHNDVTHVRQVNACLNSKGKYDAEATASRVEEVARGVAHKIEIGVITNPPPIEEVAQPAESDPQT